MSAIDTQVFPTLTPEDILECQFSSWYPRFANYSLRSTVIRPLSDAFQDYLKADGVFVPLGSDNVNDPDAKDGNKSEPEDEEGEDEDTPKYSFPELDEKIRSVIHEYGGIFPKLNWTSPKDAHWILPPTYPLKCTTPSDIYLLLKSSDFISHDLDPKTVFDGCEPSLPGSRTYHLELVLRKWYSIDKSREMRCFVRDGRLIAISQRDLVQHEWLNDPITQNTILDAIVEFWESKIVPNWSTNSYIFDFLLSRNLSKGHLIDFNPYAPKTDPILFTYDELWVISKAGTLRPTLRVIDSASHPAITRNAPTYQHNMVPLEALTLGVGKTADELAQALANSIKETQSD